MTFANEDPKTWFGERTDGRHSRVAKFQPLTIIVVRAEYDSGKRGKAHSWRHGMSPAHYNNIGRRKNWRTGFEKTKREWTL